MKAMRNQEVPKMSSVDAEELEMNHTDKLVGVFTEPAPTFEKLAKFPSKTSDWVIPILIVIVVTILSQIVLMNNPTIKAAMTEKYMTRIEKQLDEQAANGQITQAQADEQKETARERMSQGGVFQMIGIIVGTPVAVFLFFFIVTGVYLVLAKFILGGEGTYKEAMVAYGLPHYISTIQIVITIIACLLTNRLFSGTSVADFLDMEKGNIAGFLLGKLDVFSIWFYIVFGIGLAKMFKSNNTQIYIISVFAMWIGVGLLLFLIAKAVPWLSFLVG